MALSFVGATSYRARFMLRTETPVTALLSQADLFKQLPAGALRSFMQQCVTDAAWKALPLDMRLKVRCTVISDHFVRTFATFTAAKPGERVLSIGTDGPGTVLFDLSFTHSSAS